MSHKYSSTFLVCTIVANDITSITYWISVATVSSYFVIFQKSKVKLMKESIKESLLIKISMNLGYLSEKEKDVTLSQINILLKSYNNSQRLLQLKKTRTHF